MLVKGATGKRLQVYWNQKEQEVIQIIDDAGDIIVYIRTIQRSFPYDATYQHKDIVMSSYWLHFHHWLRWNFQIEYCNAACDENFINITFHLSAFKAVNTFRSDKYGHHFSRHIFKYIFEWKLA